MTPQRTKYHYIGLSSKGALDPCRGFAYALPLLRDVDGRHPTRVLAPPSPLESSLFLPPLEGGLLGPCGGDRR